MEKHQQIYCTLHTTSVTLHVQQYKYICTTTSTCIIVSGMTELHIALQPFFNSEINCINYSQHGHLDYRHSDHKLSD